jgi:hypothetical protein
MPLQTGQWRLILDGRLTSLSIKSINAGQVAGNIDGLDFAFDAAFWDEDAQKLMVVQNPNPAPPTRVPPRIFVGYLFTDQVNLTGVTGSVIFTLTGYVEHFAESQSEGITARKSVVGWYAQIGVG